MRTIKINSWDLGERWPLNAGRFYRNKWNKGNDFRDFGKWPLDTGLTVFYSVIIIIIIIITVVVVVIIIIIIISIIIIIIIITIIIIIIILILLFFILFFLR